jgi:hypothetical protein
MALIEPVLAAALIVSCSYTAESGPDLALSTFIVLIV